MMLMPKCLPLLLLLLCGAAPSFASDEGSEDTHQEKEIELPPAPRAENLLPFYVSATATQSFAIDAASLRTGDDDIVLYTLISRSPSGATTVSHEGIRCRAKMWKAYAYGRSDGSWTRSKHDQWNSIDGKASNRQQAALAEEFLCDAGLVAGTPQQMADRLKRAAKYGL